MHIPHFARRERGPRTWIIPLMLGLGWAVADAPALAAPQGADVLAEAEAVPGEILVKFKKGVRAVERRQFHREADGEVLATIPKIEIARVRSRRGETAEALIARYRQNPFVEYAEVNRVFRLQAVPNDPYFPQLYGLHNLGQTGGLVDADIDAAEAWDRQTGDPSVLVALIDTGVQYTHPDLAANMWVNPGEIPDNGIDDDTNGYVDDVRGWDFANNDNNPADDNGHGTHTAGTIAAVGNNGVGVVGVAWHSTVMPLKFLNHRGLGTAAGAIAAIMYAADMGARISSNSWLCGPSLGCFSQAVEDAIAYANAKGMLFVATAGNANNNNDLTPTFPCTSTQPNVICVAATDQFDQKAAFSSYGATTVDLGAPGVGILSTAPSNGYRLASGTSMATPHVAGAAALLLSEYPALTVLEVKRAILRNVDPLPALAAITTRGGRLNVANALNALRASFTVAATPATQSVLIGQSVQYAVTVTSSTLFSAPVTLSLVSPEPSITASFSPNPATPPADGSSQVIMTVSTTASTPAGTYALAVRGRDEQGRIHSVQITIEVSGPDFTITITPASQFTQAGGSRTFTVTARSLAGYSGPVALRMVTTNPNVAGSFSVTSVVVPPDGSTTSLLTITSSPSAPLGGYRVVIEGTDGVRTRAARVVLVVVDTDLRVTQVQPSESTVNAGIRFTVTNIVVNQGSAPAGTFAIAYRLSINAVYGDADDVVLTSTRLVPSLSGGDRYEGITHLQVPTSLPAGRYRVCAYADSASIIPETDETNNALCGGSIVVPPPDLIVPALSTNATAVAPGRLLGLSNTVQNIGGVPSGSFTVVFHLSRDPVYGGGDDIPFATGRLVASLTPGLRSAAATSLTVPVTAPPAAYYVCAFADGDNAVAESTETNNALCTTAPIQVTLPDLTVTQVQPAVTVVDAGRGLSVATTVANQGLVAAGAFSIGFRLSRNASYGDADDIAVAVTRPVAHLLPGTRDDSTTVWIPAATPAGDYYICAMADSANVVTETSEANNALCGASRITVPPPDLVVTELSTTSTGVAPGGALSARNAVRNQGGVAAGSFAVAFSLSADAVYGGSDDVALIGTRSVASLARGGSSLATTALTVPATAPPAAYYLCALADSANSVAEGDESNNARCMSTTIQIQ